MLFVYRSLAAISVVIPTLLVIWLCIVWASSTPCLADFFVKDATVNKALQSVVVIYKPSTDAKTKPNGAGFLITTDGYLLTAYHVVAPNSNKDKGITFKLKLRSDAELEARVVGQNEYLDVALLARRYFKWVN